MSTYTPFDNLTDDEFLRWLELNLQDSRKDVVVARLRRIDNQNMHYQRGFRDGAASVRRKL